MELPVMFNYSPAKVRFRLFRDLVLVLLFAIGALFLVSYLLIAEVRRDTAGSQITQAIDRVRQEVARIKDPVERQLQIIREWGRSGELNLTDHNALVARFIPTLEQMSHVSGLIIANDQGSEFFLLPKGGQWLSREREPGTEGKVTWQLWRTGRQPLRQWQGRIDYDPRQRPWFKDALPEIATGGVNWTRPYLFFTRQLPGITASLAWQGKERTDVVAMDVELGEVLKTIDALTLEANGKAFLLRRDGGVYFPQSKHTEPVPVDANSGFFLDEKSLGGSQVLDAVSVWLNSGKPADQPLRFRRGGEIWWAGFAPLTQELDSAWIGVAVPASDLLSLVERRWQLVGFTAFSVLLLGVLLAVLLVRKYSRQLKELPTLTISAEDYEQELQSLIRSGESAHLEFKSTMRMNLRSGKNGKEIELAWLKGVAAFMNTEGGIVLIGVQDDGTILGLDSDGFESQDKCQLHFKNLFNQHIGAEFSRFVRFQIYSLQGREVVAIECERAGQPVFLYNKNQEAFTIRSGPSNVELSISKALKYLQHRF